MSEKLSLLTPIALFVTLIFLYVGFLVGSNIDRKRQKEREKTNLKAK